jgi:hypothetical protein
VIEIPYNQELLAMNEKKYGCNDSTHCIICGKPVNMKKHFLFVQIVNGGGFIGNQEEADANPAASLGVYPIGATCLKSHPEIVPYIVV